MFGWLVLAAGAVAAPDAPTAMEPIRGKARAMDGDSLRVGRHHVRLWGIDAPEFDQSCDRDNRAWDCGRAAHAALASRIEGRIVVCVPRDRDTYRRLVSVCSVAGHPLNAWMVRQGWAVEYRRYSGGAYAREEREARTAGRGIWSGRFERPDRYRRQHRSR